MSITLEKILAPSPVTVRARPTQLSCDAQGQWLAYASGKSIFLRSIDNPSASKQYTEHKADTTVVRLPPSGGGRRIVSGDVNGNLKVWEDLPDGPKTTGEYIMSSKRVNDIAFTMDGQRIIAVGDGIENFGRCITVDSGNTVGEVSGHSKAINAVAMRPARPMVAATVGEDTTVSFLAGPPFRFKSKASDVHKQSVLGAAFSPDGNKLITVGAAKDERIQLYEWDNEAKEMKHSKLIGEGDHKGSICGVSWASDSKRFVTASADQTVKTWDVESGKVLQTWTFGTSGGASFDDQQVSVVWPQGRSDGLIISLSASGDLNYLKVGSEKPVQVVQGHSKPVTSLSGDSDGDGQTLLTASRFDGRVCSWDLSSGVGTVISGASHEGKAVIGFAHAGGQAFSAGWDNHLRSIDGATNTFTGSPVKLQSQPEAVASAGGRFYVATGNGIEVYTKDGASTTLAISDSEPTAVAANGSYVAVGLKNNAVRVYKVDGSNNLTLASETTRSLAQISTLTFSKDGSMLASGNSAGKIHVYKTSDLELVTDRWSAHTARVASIAFNDAGTHAVSGSLDTNLYVWSLAQPGNRKVKVMNAHKEEVTGVCWVDGGRKVVSTGRDAAIKIWKVDGLV
ncbi:WD40 repeat-like protein [Xylariaceae sp. FL1272]|nr:WD40 repeat-like protein [Xylariaceae sp. FL1272]